MRIYLDNCCLQRPLDDKSHTRIQLESEAVLAILAMCEKRQVSLVSSEVLEFELDQNPDLQRKAYIYEVLSGAGVLVEVDDTIAARARYLESTSFRGMDALHLACAEAAQVDYFCSCDDRLLRKARSGTEIRVRVLSLLELVAEIVT